MTRPRKAPPVTLHFQTRPFVFAKDLAPPVVHFRHSICFHCVRLFHPSSVASHTAMLVGVPTNPAIDGDHSYSCFLSKAGIHILFLIHVDSKIIFHFGLTFSGSRKCRYHERIFGIPKMSTHVPSEGGGFAGCAKRARCSAEVSLDFRFNLSFALWPAARLGLSITRT